jgi:hypothetical protein
MAFEGPIKFMDIPFDGVNWSEDIGSPFKQFEGVTGSQPNMAGNIEAVARHLVVPQRPGEIRVIFDQPGEAQSHSLKCVVVATEKVLRVTEFQKYYVLLVMPIHGEEGFNKYERTGVAIIRRGDVSLDTGEISVQIV